MKRSAAVAALIALAVVSPACSSSTTTTTPDAANPAVYQRIATMTDCATLQGEFDIADRNGAAARARHRLDLAEASTSYMHAADARMSQIGCY